MRIYGLLVCAQLALFAQTRNIPAGSDAQGKALTVVREKLPTAPRSQRTGKCAPGERYSLVAGNAAPQTLVTVCQDDPDNPKPWITTVSVKPGLMTIIRDGGSFAGIFDQVYQLSPWRPLSFGWCTVDGDGTWRGEEWDWSPMEGRFYGSSPDSEELCGRKPKYLQRFIIPTVEMDASVLEKSGARLGSCAMTLDASGKHGLIPWGTPDPKDPVEIKVLLTGERTLIAQVIDPGRFTGTAKSWIDSDHFEIWQGIPGLAYQFGIRLNEGPVEVGAGNPKQLPKVRRWTSKTSDGRTAIVLRIDLAPKSFDDDKGFKLIYSQSMEGRAQKRFISTSPGRKGDGSERHFDNYSSAGGFVTCAVVNGAFEVTGARRSSLVFREDELGWKP